MQYNQKAGEIGSRHALFVKGFVDFWLRLVILVDAIFVGIWLWMQIFGD